LLSFSLEGELSFPFDSLFSPHETATENFPLSVGRGRHPLFPQKKKGILPPLSARGLNDAGPFPLFSSLRLSFHPPYKGFVTPPNDIEVISPPLLADISGVSCSLPHETPPSLSYQ